MHLNRSNSYKNKPSTAETSKNANLHNPQETNPQNPVHTTMKSVSTVQHNTFFSQHGFVITITLTIIFSSLIVTLGVVFGLLIAKSPCSSSPCQHGGTCFITNVLGDYNCVCDTDYVGQNCETLLQKSD